MSFKPYTLYDYETVLKKNGLLVESKLPNAESETVRHLAYHSDAVQNGTLFFCKSLDFKKEYLEAAVERGAVAYVSETAYPLDDECPYLLVSDIRLAMPLLADLFYNSPQEKLTLIGIGGTKGKTTTAYYIKAILDDYLAAQGKQPAGLLSTIATFDGIEEEAAINTTPEAIDLQGHLARAVEAGLEYVVMEVSSQALKYHRTAGLEFDIGVFLNIDEDHISPTEHTDFNDYLESKAKMFEQTKQLLINLETKESEYILEKAKKAEWFGTFSFESKRADYFVTDVHDGGLENVFTVHSQKGSGRYRLSMPGLFNVENALAAIAVSDLLNIPQKHVQSALQTVKVPGRMGVFTTDDKEIIAVSDYAHNRLSFETLIQSMRKSYPEYQVISVFGAPGGKAFGRREELGMVGGRYSDHVILTMDDPGEEAVEDISKQIAVYVEKENTPYEIIIDREKAIKEAFQIAQSRTIILAVGKGHETIMKINGKKVSVKSDDQVIQEQIEAYNRKKKNE